MNTPESPKQKADLAEARIDWAFSFLVDWLIPTFQTNHIETPSDIIKLRERFVPLRDATGTDFTIEDVLTAALQWRAYNQQRYPKIPEDKLPDGKLLHRAIDLLNAAVHNPPKPDNPIQTTYLTD